MLDPITTGNGKAKLWPRRLLYLDKPVGGILTMISVEREDGDIYAGIQRPAYNIISYTWGRYVLPTARALDIRGVTWPIPPIDPSRFTVAEFQKIIEAVGDGVDFVWIDIACIDQQNEKMKMEEIGRQAGIFNNSKKAFIWLHGTSFTKLQDTYTQLFDLTRRLDGESSMKRNFQDDPESTVVINWEPDNYDSDGVVGQNDFIPHCMRDSMWLEDIETTLASLTSDVWFSSLWTLQEAYLRPEATLLSREGSGAFQTGFGQVTLANLLLCMGQIDIATSKALYRRISNSDGSLDAVIPLVKRLESRIQKLGLGAWDNPNILYHAASYRHCSSSLDRIYGIMQVFGFQLGASADPTRLFTLGELEAQFAQQINAISPMSGQLFIHTQREPLGNCWRISQTSDFPHALNIAIAMPASTCSIKVELSEAPVFDGYACSFGHLATLWIEAAANNEGHLFWGEDDVIQVIALDNTEFMHDFIPEELRQVEDQSFGRNEALSNIIVEKCKNELKVLLLGQFLNSEDVEQDEYSAEGSMGLLVRPVECGGRRVWQRLGICIWAMDPRDNDIWTSQQYLLG